MPAREWAISPPLCGPEVGNSKLPKREMSLSVPNFSGALLLSMRSFLQVTFFIDSKLNKQGTVTLGSSQGTVLEVITKPSTQNHPSPNKPLNLF